MINAQREVCEICASSSIQNSKKNHKVDLGSFLCVSEVAPTFSFFLFLASTENRSVRTHTFLFEKKKNLNPKPTDMDFNLNG
jgi:hypothetical protein